MPKYHSIIMRIISIIFIAAFASTQIAFGYEGRGVSSQVRQSHLRSVELAEAGSSGAEVDMASVLSGRPKQSLVSATPSIYEQVCSAVKRDGGRKPRVLLIESNILGLNNMFPPLGLYYLRSALGEFANADVEILDLGIGDTDQTAIDRCLTNKIREFQPDIVGISFTTPTSTNALRVARIAKEIKGDTVLVAGGAHVSAVYTEDVLADTPFDCFVKGEGELSFSRLVKAMVDSGSEKSLSDISGIGFRYNDKVMTTGSAERIPDLDNLPDADILPEELARYSISIFDKELKAAPIMTTRGCPYGCTFCSKAVYGSRVRKRSLDRVMAEINRYYERGITFFVFIDDAFGVDSKRVAQLCDMIINSGLNGKISWRATIRTDVVDYELLCKMKKSGCVAIGFGVESGSQRILDRVVKKGTTVAQNLRTIRLAKKAGIEEVRLFMMVGLPGETEKDVRETIEFVKKANPTNIGLSVATPFPGSEWGNNLDEFGTRIIAGYDQFIPYVKLADTGKYTTGPPPIAHETAYLDREGIARVYDLTREELADYMFDVTSNRKRFVIARIENCMDIFEATGLQREFGLYVVDAAKEYNIYIQKILDQYRAWRALDRRSDDVWHGLGVEYPESLADHMIMTMLLLHHFSSQLGIDAGDAASLLLSAGQHDAGHWPAEFLQLNRLAHCIQAAYMLKEDIIDRGQYVHMLDHYGAEIHNSSLGQILNRLRNIGSHIDAQAISSIVAGAEMKGQFAGQDLVLTPMVTKSEYERGLVSHNEVVAILKPPTTVKEDGSINKELMREIVTRFERLGYEVAGLRMFDGQHLDNNMLQNLYFDAYQGYRHGVTNAAANQIKTIYDRPDFEKVFGCPFDPFMVIPARDLVTEHGLTDEEVDALWAPARFPISVYDFEAKYNVRVKIVDDGENVSGLMEDEIAIPRSMTVMQGNVLMINWFEQEVPWGINKIAQATNVFPVKDPRINEGNPVLVVNGHIPGLFRHFKKPGNKTIALLLRRRKDSTVSLEGLRNLVGDNNMPDRNPTGTIRRDAFDGLLAIPGTMRAELRGNNNVIHASSSLIEGAREGMAFFGLPAKDTVFGQFLMRNGYSLEQIEYLLSNPKVRRLAGGDIYEERGIFELTSKMDDDNALEVIRQFFPPYCIDDPMNTPSVSFAAHINLIGNISSTGNRLRPEQIRAPSLQPVVLNEISEERQRRYDTLGEELLQNGKVAVLIAAGGEGGRKMGYMVSDPAKRDKVHNTILNLNVLGRPISANLAQIRASHIRGIQQGRKRNIQTLIMGNDRNLSHIMTLWEEAEFYGLDPLDITSYPQNGIYRFNPSREDLLQATSVLEEMRKNHAERVRHGLLPANHIFDVNWAVNTIMARNGNPGDLFRTDEGFISTKPCGNMEMLIQPFLNGTLAYLAEHGCEILIVPNGDDMGFYIDRRRLGYFSTTGKQMMASLTERGSVKTGGFLADVDLLGNGNFKSWLVEKDNLPDGFDYSTVRYRNTGQNYFSIPGIFEFFMKGGNTGENLKMYYRLNQRERLELVNAMLESVHFNYAVKPVVVGIDHATDGVHIPRMSAAGQLERIIPSMTGVLTATYILVDPNDFCEIKVYADEEKAQAAIMKNIEKGVPYRFAQKQSSGGVSSDTVSAVDNQAERDTEVISPNAVVAEAIGRREVVEALTQLKQEKSIPRMFAAVVGADEGERVEFVKGLSGCGFDGVAEGTSVNEARQNLAMEYGLNAGDFILTIDLIENKLTNNLIKFELPFPPQGTDSNVYDSLQRYLKDVKTQA